ncbi:MAG TPA: 3-phosphoglycerate dehydrogenase [Anaerovoracaceae bacterium]|nr:3-phosphoglycerate dehydrogenase [Anaerovoracaceae bacterium]
MEKLYVSTLNNISTVGLNHLNDNYALTEDIDKAKGILVRSHGMHDMEFSEDLMAIARAGAGVNNIPLEKCADKGIVVFNTPGANANAVKELVIAGILISARNIDKGMAWASTLSENVSKEVEKGKKQFAGTEIKGKKLGVVGLGAIGVLVANAATALGMQVYGTDPFFSTKAALNLNSNVEFVPTTEEMLAECDYVSLHLPSLESTKGMFNKDMIKNMKDGSVLLNFARGNLIIEEDILDALKIGNLGKYVTDFPSDSIINKEGVVSIPHLGASTEEAEDNCATMATLQLMDYIENGNIVNSVNYPAVSMKALPNTKKIAVMTKDVDDVISMLSKALGGSNILEFATNKKGAYGYTLVMISKDCDTCSVNNLNDKGIIKVREI